MHHCALFPIPRECTTVPPSHYCAMVCTVYINAGKTEKKVGIDLINVSHTETIKKAKRLSRKNEKKITFRALPPDKKQPFVTMSFFCNRTGVKSCMRLANFWWSHGGAKNRAVLQLAAFCGATRRNCHCLCTKGLDR